MALTLDTAIRSVVGAHRSSNQDSVAAADDVVVVADGVGGHVGGDVASWVVTHRLMALLATRPARTVGVEDLRELIALANADLALAVRRDHGLAGMATTFTGLFCADQEVRVAHIGDSRAYLLRAGEGRRVTRDDSLVQAMVESGTIEAAEAFRHPHRNVILRSLSGSPADADGLTVLSVTAEVGDRWLVASDGLTDYVADEELLALLAGAGSCEEAADRLVQAALDGDSRDNITVGVSDVVEDGAVTRGTAGGVGLRFLGAAGDPDRGFVGDLSGPSV